VSKDPVTKYTVHIARADMANSAGEPRGLTLQVAVSGGRAEVIGVDLDEDVRPGGAAPLFELEGLRGLVTDSPGAEPGGVEPSGARRLGCRPERAVPAPRAAAGRHARRRAGNPGDSASTRPPIRVRNSW
jgi:hypothetical protein